MVTYVTTLKFSDIICTKLGRDLVVLLLVGVSCIIVCMSSTMISMSYLVHQWCILRYSTYLVRVTAVFGSTKDLLGYSYKARSKFGRFTLGWLIPYQYLYAINNDFHVVFSISMMYIEILNLFGESYGSFW